ncbi:hypothetical protein A3D70_01330 [Candidatus Adlerbacteria bacterium RIFCSPHIGHO2_02_FULL_54_18]|uniref:Uncharacterized protein n=2 Tax=Candidatus Adleribacteriota TaxID=1752736 RepID=A0A1F4Y3G8_9BACT|nr:MAG: hypothetical protein A2949_01895 [Candidatus Adlerbacteria bacterium RIFCSPLOWO2_01_FULL_54_21b]OGC87853.1 MAG: hypothetical protein A3D70_01330 [Candidatus Adlerbacteria bacterium RIFCSPHIGHO2_02_FULL_54_18]
MEQLIIDLTAHPLRYIEYFLATLGAVGALLFIAGAVGGIPFFFNYSADQQHMNHARTRAVWGIYLCMLALGLWEIVRVIIGRAPPSYLFLACVLLAPLWLPWLYSLITGKSSNEH